VLSFCVSRFLFFVCGRTLADRFEIRLFIHSFQGVFCFFSTSQTRFSFGFGLFFYHLFIALKLCSMNLFSPRNSVVFLTNLHFTSRNTSVISWVNNRERSRTSRDTPARKRQPSDTQILELSDSDTPGIRQYVLLRRQSN